MKKYRGMGSVFQPTYSMTAPDGSKIKKTASTWWVKYYVHGKPIRENAHTANRADAVRLLKKRTGDAANGKPVGPDLDRTTLADLLAMVEADYCANSRRSLDRVQQAGVHLRSFFGDARKAHDITADLITRYAAHRLAEKAAPSSVNYEMAMLRRGFRLASKAGKVGVRPEIDMLHVSNTRQGFFEPYQYRAVLAHLPHHLKPALRVAYATGWRTKSEILTRQWRHVDFNAGWLHLEPGEGKTGQARAFPFTAELRAILEAQREYVREIEKATGRIIPWLFVHPLNGGRAPAGSRIKDFRGAWKKACREAGIPGKLVHDFRRTAVRNLERAGVPRSAAMKLTGHRTEAVYARYAIVDSGMLQEAALKLDALAEANGPRIGQETATSAKV